MLRVSFFFFFLLIPCQINLIMTTPPPLDQVIFTTTHGNLKEMFHFIYFIDNPVKTLINQTFTRPLGISIDVHNREVTDFFLEKPCTNRCYTFSFFFFYWKSYFIINLSSNFCITPEMLFNIFFFFTFLPPHGNYIHLHYFLDS